MRFNGHHLVFNRLEDELPHQQYPLARRKGSTARGHAPVSANRGRQAMSARSCNEETNPQLWLFSNMTQSYLFNTSRCVESKQGNTWVQGLCRMALRSSVAKAKAEDSRSDVNAAMTRHFRLYSDDEGTRPCRENFISARTPRVSACGPGKTPQIIGEADRLLIKIVWTSTCDYDMLCRTCTAVHIQPRKHVPLVDHAD